MPFARADGTKRIDSVAPPVESAEQAHDDDLGVARACVDPEIDRHRVAELAEMHQPERWQRVLVGGVGRCQPGEIAVDEGQHDDIARRLAEIDRLDDVVECR